jgi:hypothetical protein
VLPRVCACACGWACVHEVLPRARVCVHACACGDRVHVWDYRRPYLPVISVSGHKDVIMNFHWLEGPGAGAGGAAGGVGGLPWHGRRRARARARSCP